MIEQDYMSEQWFELLMKQITTKTMRVVADELNYSKTTLSLIINRKYKGKTDRVRDKVLAIYAQVHCPHQNQVIVMSECVALATSSAPTHNPLKMQQWRACQRCPNKPECGEKS
ncbi:XRE family transcriptional regulator [Simonsiella muelleri]|uniref:Uncharacterized protein n=1 Tax=Simonsiella muelleri ATCC 29453 TaxID=641147 RepID=U6Q368_9NEIS|nr:hypothetical protein [Simonsiella muelleri]AUX60822.1 hypothetical protein BWP33_02585 [Simonsiella muelleri ATCC 29453]AUX62256.1 hypothetical protein BWP33_10845 [Simonsiella muelleri ATCC 29453]EFG29884.1 hypothetical protein HMPREF9021_02291 [Simonsiella muelleri ATCC 29453]EJZ50289.1 hypothetical protein HMPREF9021_02482 [Simonsiella muelleri ATCC 29453]UBQ54355.1 XRE family transcriptional regulator [Simonsiella muelleri]